MTKCVCVCVRTLCVCVTKLCVCVTSCMCKSVWDGAHEKGGGGGRDTEPETRTPHKDVGKKVPKKNYPYLFVSHQTLRL